MDSAPECDRLAESVESSGGVVVVPAFTGLGAPYWDMYARGAILGITRGTGRAHIARAVLECIAYQVTDLMLAMRQDAGCDITALRRLTQERGLPFFLTVLHCAINAANAVPELERFKEAQQN